VRMRVSWQSTSMSEADEGAAERGVRWPPAGGAKPPAEADQGNGRTRSPLREHRRAGMRVSREEGDGRLLAPWFLDAARRLCRVASFQMVIQHTVKPAVATGKISGVSLRKCSQICQVICVNVTKILPRVQVSGLQQVAVPAMCDGRRGRAVGEEVPRMTSYNLRPS
jgi:hypothetical protein